MGDDGLERLTSTHEFLISRLIARGGMGAVYEAQQQGAAEFAKTVAIKTIHKQFAADPEFVRLFIGEAKLVADLVHENIVQVYSLNTLGHDYFIVMEFVDGVTLEKFIQYHLDVEMPLPVELGAFIISRVCRGLEYAHKKRGWRGEELGIVHRDISPKNVLINFEGVVKVTDFGIAKALHVMEQDEQILMGRIEYMSPEQARREETDRRSDLYSLGVLMYELLTGRVPSRGWGSVEQLHKAKAAYATPPRLVRADLPEDLCDIVELALAPDPEDRFQTAGEMGYALEYHLYSEGYGPTNVTLGDYLKEHFSGFRTRVEEPGHRPDDESAHEVEHRSQTLFSDQLTAFREDEGSE